MDKVEQLRELRAIFRKLLFRGSTQKTADQETARLINLFSEMVKQMNADVNQQHFTKG